MFSKIIHSTDNLNENRAIFIASHHNRNAKRAKREYKTRTESTFNTKAYKDALQRAFNKAKQQVYFNPDMQYFVTLTYKGIESDVAKAMHDVKMLVKSERRNGHDIKYIYVFEWQKRGSLHIHMITNAQLTTYTNKNGYKSLTYWKHGYTSMLHVNDFDSNFRPHLYLFKYMRKSERIGKSFVHSSRNLNNFKQIEFEDFDLLDYDLVNDEYSTTTLHNKKLHFYRYYLKRDIMNTQQFKGVNQCQPKTAKSHYTKEQEKPQKSHLQPLNSKLVNGQNSTLSIQDSKWTISKSTFQILKQQKFNQMQLTKSQMIFSTINRNNKNA